MPSLPRLDDRGVALLYLAAGLLLHGAGVSVTGSTAAGPGGWWWHTALLLVACGALTAKRRHPVAVLVLAAACAVASVPAGGSLGLMAQRDGAQSVPAPRVRTARPTRGEP